MNLSDVKPAIVRQRVKNIDWDIGGVLLLKDSEDAEWIHVINKETGDFDAWHISECEPVPEEQRIASDLEALQDS